MPRSFLVDHQVGLLTGVRDYSTGELKHNVVALAKAAKALKLTDPRHTTAREACGSHVPKLVEALPGIESSTVHRSTVPRARVAARHRGHGPQEADLRRHLSRSLRSFSGNDRVSKGLDAYVAVDASGRSARPSGKSGLCACCRQASFSGLRNLMVEIAGQCTAGGGRGLRSHRHGLGQACRTNCQATANNWRRTPRGYKRGAFGTHPLTFILHQAAARFPIFLAPLRSPGAPPGSVQRISSHLAGMLSEGWNNESLPLG